MEKLGQVEDQNNTHADDSISGSYNLAYASSNSSFGLVEVEFDSVTSTSLTESTQQAQRSYFLSELD